MRIAILDDYQSAALGSADWTTLPGCEVVVFNAPLGNLEAAAKALEAFDILCLMRERTPISRALLQRLPGLRFITTTGPENRSIDLAAAAERGVIVSHTLPSQAATWATVELTWTLLLAAARDLCEQHGKMRVGGWQSSVGTVVRGKTLGLLGLGRIGSRVAGIAGAFGMDVIAWSPGLTSERASQAGARRVEKQELLERSDFLSIHLVLAPRTTGLLGRVDLQSMRRSAFLINTARAAIVDETALLEALRSGWIAGAALDVFGSEPPDAEHPLRLLHNVVLSPHMGYVSRETLRDYYSQSVENIAAFLSGAPIRLLVPPVN